MFIDEEPVTFNCIVDEHGEQLEDFLDIVQTFAKGFEFKFGNEEHWEKIKCAMDFLHMEHQRGCWSSNLNEEKIAEQSEGNTDFEI